MFILNFLSPMNMIERRVPTSVGEEGCENLFLAHFKSLEGKEEGCENLFLAHFKSLEGKPERESPKKSIH